MPKMDSRHICPRQMSALRLPLTLATCGMFREALSTQDSVAELLINQSAKIFLSSCPYSKQSFEDSPCPELVTRTAMLLESLGIRNDLDPVRAIWQC